MGKEGLVRKVKDLDRKNQVRLVLMEKGREAYYQSEARFHPQDNVLPISGRALPTEVMSAVVTG